MININGVDNLSNSQGFNDDDEDDLANNHENYKGIYFGDSEEQQFYEGGAHFSYKVLCTKLEKLLKVLSPDRKGKEMYEGEISGGLSMCKTKADSGKYAAGEFKENNNANHLTFNKATKSHGLKDEPIKKGNMLKNSVNHAYHPLVVNKVKSNSVMDKKIQSNNQTGQSNSNALISQNTQKVSEKVPSTSLQVKESNLKKNQNIMNTKYTPSKAGDLRQSNVDKTKDKMKENASPLFKIVTTTTSKLKNVTSNINGTSNNNSLNQGAKSRNQVHGVHHHGFESAASSAAQAHVNEVKKPSTISHEKKSNNTQQPFLFETKSRNVKKQQSEFGSNNQMSSNSSFNKNVVLSFKEMHNNKSRNINNNKLLPEKDSSKSNTTENKAIVSSIEKLSNSKISKDTKKLEILSNATKPSNKMLVMPSSKPNTSNNKFKINNKMFSTLNKETATKPSTAATTNVVKNVLSRNNISSSHVKTNNQNFKERQTETNTVHTVQNTCVNTSSNNALLKSSSQAKTNQSGVIVQNYICDEDRLKEGVEATNSQSAEKKAIQVQVNHKSDLVSSNFLLQGLGINVCSSGTRNVIPISESKTSIHANLNFSSANNKNASSSPVKLIGKTKTKNTVNGYALNSFQTNGIYQKPTPSIKPNSSSSKLSTLNSFTPSSKNGSKILTGFPGYVSKTHFNIKAK